MATETILMEAVRRGGDRQSLHEAIRQHSVAAGARVKAEGLDNDMLDRLRDDPAFASVKDDLESLCDPRRFVGRAPEQVEVVGDAPARAFGQARAHRRADRVMGAPVDRLAHVVEQGGGEQLGLRVVPCGVGVHL